MLLKKLDFILSALIIPFAFLGSLIFSIRKEKKQTLIIRPGGMGDLIVLTNAIKRAGRDLDSYFWLIEKRSEVWAKYLKLSYACYDDSVISTVLMVAGAFKNVINTEQLFGLSNVYSILCKRYKGNLTSFNTNRYSYFSTTTVPYDHLNSHELTEFSKILGLEMGDLLIDADNKNREDYSVLWVSGKGVTSRDFELSFFSELIKQKLTKKLFIIASPTDKLFAQQLVQNSLNDTSEINLFEGSFTELCKLLSRSKELITIDGGPVHIGSYFGIVTKSVFTAGVLKKWHPLTKGSIIYYVDYLSCSPCTRFGQVPPCTNNFKCKKIDFSKSLKVEEIS